jgi:hypothetical protein
LVPSWDHRFYLNAACSTPNIDLACSILNTSNCQSRHTFSVVERAAIWPFCLYSEIGQPIDILGFLAKVDKFSYSNNTLFPLAPSYYGYLPPNNLSVPAHDWYMPPDKIGTEIPFTLYAIGAVSCFLFLVLSTSTLPLLNETNPSIVWLKSSPVPALVILMLNFIPVVGFVFPVWYFNHAIDSIEITLNDAKTEEGNSVNVGHPFLTLGWIAVVSQVIATLSTGLRWHRLRRTQN